MVRNRMVRNTLVSIGIFTAAAVLSMLFQKLDVGEHVTTIFVFAVFLISLFTEGYYYGIVSALLGVLAVNYAFTYPYFTLDLRVPVNLISAAIMTAVSVLTGMLTTKIKYFENAKAEGERERMRANLLRAVSHDLRTPLTTIYSASSTLRSKGKRMTEEQRDTMLKNIEEDSGWLVRMVENLLSVTRIDNEGLRIVRSPVILDELVDSVMTKFLARYHNQKVVIEIPDTVAVVSVDALLMEQLLMNLLENAVFHAANMTQILFRVYEEGERIVFEIADDGCGIEEEKLKHIFSGKSEFGSVPADSGKRNAGIGLSVCAAIVKAHEGEIHAKNRREGGALFCFSLKKEEMADVE